jgi:hypothetical protein
MDENERLPGERARLQAELERLRVEAPYGVGAELEQLKEWRKRIEGGLGRRDQVFRGHFMGPH